MSKRTLLLILLFLLGLAVVLHLLIWINYDEYYRIISFLRFAFYLGFLGSLYFYLAKEGQLILSNITLFLALVFLMELVFFFISGMPYLANRSFKSPDHEMEHMANYAGTVPWRDSSMRDVKTNFADTVFDVTYSIDNDYRRVTPKPNSPRSEHALFFGCSVCFGYGLDDSQTLPYFFQEKSDNYQSYNYAYTGYGTNNVLGRLEYEESCEVKQGSGIGVYVFLWTHIRRNIGAMEVYTSWGHAAPYYDLEEDMVVRKGNFVQDRSWTSKMYELLYWSFTARYFGLRLPSKTVSEHFNLTAALIAEVRSRYLSFFPNDKFYVLIYPIESNEFSSEDKSEMLELLDAKGLQYFNYDQAFKMNREYVIEGDDHPNSKANEKISELFLRDLRK